MALDLVKSSMNEAEKLVLANRIVELSRRSQTSCVSGELFDTFRIIDPKDRQDIALKAIALGGEAVTIQNCLDQTKIYVPWKVPKIWYVLGGVGVLGVGILGFLLLRS